MHIVRDVEVERLTLPALPIAAVSFFLLVRLDATGKE
jgi:hypothetical protein